MPVPCLIALRALVIAKEHGPIAAQEHHEAPEKEEGEVVQWRQADQSVENEGALVRLLAVVFVRVRQEEVAG